MPLVPASASSRSPTSSGRTRSSSAMPWSASQSSGLHANGFTLVRRLLGADAPDPELLAPTALYLDDVRRLRDECELHGLAHITGGGLPANLARVVPSGLTARLDPASWPRPPVFDWLTDRGVSEEEQRRVFNLGIGMCAVVSAETAERAGAPVIGQIVAGAPAVTFA